MKLRRCLVLFIALALSLGIMVPASAAVSAALEDTAAYLQKTVPDPQVGSIGGEWAVLGLARSGCNVPESYFENYYKNVVSYVEDCGGVLHNRKYTEYSRVVLALTAIGKDPADVGGYDLVAPLGDYDKTVWQGINGGIFALIALDSGGYELPAGSTASREKYVDFILEREISGGGWALSGDEPDVDITAMALQALAKYQDREDVKAATGRALSWLSDHQNPDGSFSSYNAANCESTAQVVVALCELGIDLEDSRFVKGGSSPVDALLTYYTSGSGFTHIKGSPGSTDGMSTEQGFYALAAASRAANGLSSLYRMSGSAPDASSGSAAFPDIAGHENQAAIEALAEKGIINGRDDGVFAPNLTMTRAEFCTITVKALGLTPRAAGVFSDVASDAWYAGYVGAASDAGVVNGVGDGKFNPEGTITRQEAAAMVTRAAKVLGLNGQVSDANEILAAVSDGAEVAAWARDAAAFCYESGIFRESPIQPTKEILRCEIAQMIYNLLDAAGKL